MEEFVFLFFPVQILFEMGFGIFMSTIFACFVLVSKFSFFNSWF